MTVALVSYFEERREQEELADANESSEEFE